MAGPIKLEKQRLVAENKAMRVKRKAERAEEAKRKRELRAQALKQQRELRELKAKAKDLGIAKRRSAKRWKYSNLLILSQLRRWKGG